MAQVEIFTSHWSSVINKVRLVDVITVYRNGLCHRIFQASPIKRYGSLTRKLLILSLINSKLIFSIFICFLKSTRYVKFKSIS